jgi:polysaccharide export outer membrane protein
MLIKKIVIHFEQVLSDLGKYALILSLLILGGCASPTYSSKSDVQKALMLKNTVSDDYHIGSGDQISINVWRNPDLSISVPVRPDGKISIPLAGDVIAKGLTPTQLGVAVTNKLSQFVKDPKVSVVIQSMASYSYKDRVRVTGAVKTPLSVPYKDGMTVLDMVLEAGGPNDFADASHATLYREMGKKVVAIPINVKNILTQGDLSSNYKLLPGDVISIPESSF